MRNFSNLAIVVSHEGNDDSDFYEPVVKMSNGSNSVQCSDFESALGMLPPGSEVSVIANGTVGNKTVHRLARVSSLPSIYRRSRSSQKYMTARFKATKICARFISLKI